MLESIQMQRYQYLLSLTNARVELIDMECVTNLFGEIQPMNLCVMYESPTNPVNQSQERVYSVCRELGIRPILDQEISFAIIDNKCDVYCNSQVPCGE